jgi:hypothetical protein
MQNHFILSSNQKLLTGNHLKLIAVVAMLMDHIAYTIIWKLYSEACVVDGVHLMGDIIPNEAKKWYLIYMTMRSIGRIAFPIFAFMLVQGFLHTRNLKKYGFRILIFALISEIPYDLAMSNRIVDFSYQNVLWTLLVALIMLYGIKVADKQTASKRILLSIFYILAAMMITLLIRSDYWFGGILFIVCLYIFRNQPLWQFITGTIFLIIMSFNFMWIQLFGISSFILFINYNGTSGNGNKYLFYVFYPLHLLILGLIATFLF